MVLRRRSQCATPSRCIVVQRDREVKRSPVRDVHEEESTVTKNDNDDTTNTPTSLTQQSSSTSVWLSTKFINDSPDLAQSSRNLSGWSSWIIQTNITRLQTAHQLLTPVVNYIINFASAYTSGELLFKLTEHIPICEISSNQYASALKASEIISDVCNQLTSVEFAFKSPSKMVFNVNSIPDVHTDTDTAMDASDGTVKKDHRTNLEQMAERICIDRDLMKQLMELHELIADTIEQLKVSLDQISIEGIPIERHEAKTRGSLTQTDIEKNFEVIDRNLIRRDVARNFIVVGEPKNAQCYYARKEEQEFQTEPTRSYEALEVMKKTARQSEKSRKSASKVHKSSDKSRKDAERSRKKERKRRQLLEGRSSSSFQEVEMVVDNFKQLNVEPDSEPVCTIRNERCPQTACEYNVKSSALLNVKELNELYGKRASFTVGVRSYSLKCDEDVSTACAILLDDSQVQQEQVDMAAADNDKAPLVIAESDSIEFRKVEEEIPEPAELVEDPVTDNASTQVLIPSRDTRQYRLMEDKDVSCKLSCMDVPSAQCQREYAELREYMDEIADEVLTMDPYVPFDDMSFDEFGYETLPVDYTVKQKAIHCMRQFKELKRVLRDLNFSEVEAQKPSTTECCERNYLHVHCEVLGIPIRVRITESYMNMLMPKYDDQDTQTNVAFRNKGCHCKLPMSLKELFKEKCALSQMLRSRNNLSDKNRVVMINLQQLQDDIFAMPVTNKPVSLASKPEVLEIVDAYSDSELPYMVSRQSLPALNVCGAKNVTVDELKSRMRDTEIQHPNPTILRYLKNLGIENLIKASLPAKCCNATVINEEEQPNEPLRASLNSLPLTTSDLDLITDVATSVKVYSETCKYRPINFYINVSFKFKFEKYTNFQEFVRPKMRVYQIFYFEIFKKENEIASTRFNNRLVRSHRRHHERNQEKTHNFIVAFLRRFVFLSEPNEKNNKKHGDTRKEHRYKTRTRSPFRAKRRTSSSSVKICTKRDRRVQTWPHEIDRYMRFEAIKEEDEHTSKTYTIPQVSESGKHVETQEKSKRTISQTPESWKHVDTLEKQMGTIPQTPENWKDVETQEKSKGKFPPTFESCKHIEAQEKPKRSIPEKKLEVHFGPRRKLQRTKTLINRTMLQKEKKNETNIHTVKSVYSTRRYRQHVPEMKDSKSDNLVKKNYPKESDEKSIEIDIPPISAEKDEKESSQVDSITVEEIPEICQKVTNENLGTIYESDERSPTPERVVEALTKNDLPAEEFWSMYFSARRNAHSASNTYSLTSDDEQVFHRKKKLRSRIPKRIQLSDSSSDFSSSIQSSVSVRKPNSSARTLPPSPKLSRETSKSKHQIPTNAKVDDMRTNYFIEYNLLPQTSLPKQNQSKERTNSTRSKHGIEKKKTVDNFSKSNVLENSYLSDILEDTERNTVSSDMKTIQSLQMLATKQGPGYITVLHPVCGCPEVSIFIPCYCDDLDGPKQKPLSLHKINKLLSDRRGRHIILPTKTRIPLDAQTLNKYKTKQRSNNLSNHIIRS